MSITDVFSEMRADGIFFQSAGDSLRIRGPTPAVEKWSPRIPGLKTELLALLRSQQSDDQASRSTKAEERAFALAGEFEPDAAAVVVLHRRAAGGKGPTEPYKAVTLADYAEAAAACERYGREEAAKAAARTAAGGAKERQKLASRAVGPRDARGQRKPAAEKQGAGEDHGPPF